MSLIHFILFYTVLKAYTTFIVIKNFVYIPCAVQYILTNLYRASQVVKW